MTTRLRWFDCRFAFDIPVERFPDILERLRGTPVRAVDRVGQLTLSVRIAKPNGAWSIQENVGHLLDLEPLWWARWENYRDRQPKLTVADLDNRRTHSANHNQADPGELLAGFRTERARLVAALEEADPALWSATALHPRLQQPMRLLDHAFFVAEHDDHHLATISALLRQLTQR